MFKPSSENYILNVSEVTKKEFRIIGEKSIQEFNLHKNNVGLKDSFIITSNSYTEYINSIQLLPKLMQKLANKKYSDREIEEISFEIMSLVESGDLPNSLKSDLESLYRFIKFKDKYPRVYFVPSIIFSNLSSVENNFPEYEDYADNFEKFESYIKKIWANLFQTSLLKARLNGDDRNIESIAIIIKLNVSAEISGVGLFDNTSNEARILAEYGDFDRNTSFADEYVVHLERTKLLSKRVGIQTSMSVYSKNVPMQIPVSFEWQRKQKLSDHKISELSKIIRKISKVIGNSFEIYWGIHHGEIFIKDIKEDKYKNYILKNDGVWEFKDFIDESEEVFKKDLERIYHLEAPVQNIFQLSKETGFLTRFVEENKLIKRLRQGFSTEILTDLIDPNQKYYLNYSDNININFQETNSYEGIYIDLGAYAKRKNIETEKKSQHYYDNFKEYTIDVSNLAFYSNKKPIICKLSDYSDENLDASKSVEQYIKNLGSQILSVKKLIEDYDFKNIDIALPGIASLEDLKYFYLIFSSIGINSKGKNRILTSINTPSFLYEINRESFALTNLLDGVIIEFDILLQRFFNKSVFTDRDLKIFVEALSVKLDKLTRHGIDLYIKINDDIERRVEATKEFNVTAYVVDGGRYT